MKFKIEFLSWACKAALEIEAETFKEAVEKAVKEKKVLSGASLDGASLYGASLDGASLDGASLDGASLRNASLYGASLYGASLDGAKLWSKRPIIQLGPCGRRNAYTNVFFFADGSEPLIKTGCFSGNLEEFRSAIQKTHGGTFHEREYLALADHIEALFAIQKGGVND